MSIHRQRGSYASEQSPGAVSPELPQQDRVRVENVRTGIGQNLTLAVVADGDGHPQAGESAEMLVAQLFKEITRSRDRDLNSLLLNQLEISGQALMDARRSLLSRSSDAHTQRGAVRRAAWEPAPSRNRTTCSM